MKNNLRFHLPASASPTNTQLKKHLQIAGWKSTCLRTRADFKTEHLDFDPKAAETFEFKHLLAKLCRQHCPELLPQSWNINDENWPFIINELEQFSLKNPQTGWILKPSLMNNGQHIHLFKHVRALKQHYQQGDRMGGEHLVQQYIDPPHLLKGPESGHKYSLRLFLILSNFQGAGLYPEGYFNIALKPYPGQGFDVLQAHLTNEHLSQDGQNVVQIPSRQYPIFQTFYPQIKSACQLLVKAIKAEFPDAFSTNAAPRLGFFGVDFMLDHREKLWLLEINHGPCFPIEENHPLQQPLYDGFWQAVIKDFITPLALNRPAEMTAFDLL